ncbi:hypothetical protein C8R44DRAFT_74761 [Mycena epipterygia]|nr:hypothetical protein C8R44DRAFT_74761 [Mycena epipterygia]
MTSESAGTNSKAGSTKAAAPARKNGHDTASNPRSTTESTAAMLKTSESATITVTAKAKAGPMTADTTAPKTKTRESTRAESTTASVSVEEESTMATGAPKKRAPFQGDEHVGGGLTSTTKSSAPPPESNTITLLLLPARLSYNCRPGSHPKISVPAPARPPEILPPPTPESNAMSTPPLRRLRSRMRARPMAQLGACPRSYERAGCKHARPCSLALMLLMRLALFGTLGKLSGVSLSPPRACTG